MSWLRPRPWAGNWPRLVGRGSCRLAAGYQLWMKEMGWEGAELKIWGFRYFMSSISLSNIFLVFLFKTLKSFAPNSTDEASDEA